MTTNKKNPLLTYLEDDYHFNSIRNLIPHLLSMPDDNITKNAISSSIYWLNKELTDQFYTSSEVFPPTDFSEAYNILFSLNKDKKSNLYSPTIAFYLDYYDWGKKIIKEQNLDNSSKRFLENAVCTYAKAVYATYKQSAAWGANEDVLNHQYHKQKKILDNYCGQLNLKDGLPIYDKLMKNYPSLSLAVITQKYGYDMNHITLQEVFNFTDAKTTGSFNEVSREMLVDFVTIFTETKYFNNSIAPVKNLQKRLLEFYGKKTPIPASHSIKYKRDEKPLILYYHPVLEKAHLSRKLDQQELLQEYGKITVHEEDIAKLKEKKAAKTVKRPKI